jgi:DNA-binding NarL/FixJ family response regulator
MVMTMPRRRRIVIADDHPAVLIALTRILEPHVDVVAVAIDGEDLLRQVGNLFPDAVVTDISMPRMNGLDACGHIRRMYPTVRVVIVSELLDDEITAEAFERGASGVVRKSEMARKLPAAVLALFTATADRLQRRIAQTKLASCAAISHAHEVAAHSRKIVARSIDMRVLLDGRSHRA